MLKTSATASAIVSRRRILQAMAAGVLLTQTPLAYSLNSPKKRVYIDGLSFLPDDLADLASSKLDAYLCDISAIEAIKSPMAPPTINGLTKPAWTASLLR